MCAQIVVAKYSLRPLKAVFIVSKTVLTTVESAAKSACFKVCFPLMFQNGVFLKSIGCDLPLMGGRSRQNSSGLGKERTLLELHISSVVVVACRQNKATSH